MNEKKQPNIPKKHMIIVPQHHQIDIKYQHVFSQQTDTTKPAIKNPSTRIENYGDFCVLPLHALISSNPMSSYDNNSEGNREKGTAGVFASLPTNQKQYTLEDERLEPTNHPIRKENDLANLHDYVPC